MIIGFNTEKMLSTLVITKHVKHLHKKFQKYAQYTKSDPTSTEKNQMRILS